MPVLWVTCALRVWQDMYDKQGGQKRGLGSDAETGHSPAKKQQVMSAEQVWLVATTHSVAYSPTASAHSNGMQSFFAAHTQLCTP